MRVLMFPYSKSNPYQRLLSQGLKDVGVEVSFDKRLLSSEHISGHSFDIFHLHWLPVDLLRRGSLLFRLFLLRHSRIPVVWTVHNLFSHKGGGVVELWYRRLVARLSSKIICHCRKAKSLVEEVYRVDPKKVVIVEHGNYIGVYPGKPAKKEARETLGLEDGGLVFLYFGAVSRYKGIPKLLGDFKRLNKKATLVVAGRVGGDISQKNLEVIGGRDERIKLVFEFIPEEAVSTYFAASDVVVLPYKSVLTSGGTSLATSFGKPVIAPKMGCIPEQLGQGERLFYNSQEENGLFNALNQAFNEDLEELGKRNLEKAKSLPWSKIGESTAEVYKEVQK